MGVRTITTMLRDAVGEVLVVVVDSPWFLDRFVLVVFDAHHAAIEFGRI